MKSKSAPRDLEMSPQSYEIHLYIPDPIGESDEIVAVDIKFGDDVAGIHHFNKSECLRVAKWFAQLAEALK